MRQQTRSWYLALVVGFSLLIVGRGTAQNQNTEEALRKAQQRAEEEQRARIEAQKEAERARNLAESARLEAIRERDRAVKAEAEARQQRDAARAAELQARKGAEAAAHQAEEALAKARAQAEKLLYQSHIATAQKELQAKDASNDSIRRDLLKEALRALEAQQADLQNKYDRQIVDLTKQLKALEIERHKTIDDFGKKKALVSQQIQQQALTDAKPPASGDKLDQILQRLEKIEQRLQQLERRPR